MTSRFGWVDVEVIVLGDRALIICYTNVQQDTEMALNLNISKLFRLLVL